MSFSFTIYDYDNKPSIHLVKGYDLSDIKGVFVHVLSGDETGYLMMNDNDIYEFDASETRMRGYDDGGYVIMDKKEIEKWIKFKPSATFTGTISYARLNEWGRYCLPYNVE